LVSDRDLLMTISCLEATLTELGHNGFDFQAGVKAAVAALA
jgi:hypothetical protein